MDPPAPSSESAVDDHSHIQIEKENRDTKKQCRLCKLHCRPNWQTTLSELYRECLRRAKYVGHQQHNTALLVDMVRQQFKQHKHETDPDKIQNLKDAAARGLINHMLYESEKSSGRKFSQRS